MRSIDNRIRINRYIPVFLLLSGLISCKPSVAVRLTGSPKFIIRPQIEKVFDLSGMLEGITFLNLKGQKTGLGSVSKLKAYLGRYYLHDKEIKRLQIFDCKGDAISSLDNVDSFDLYLDRLYTYNVKTGVLVVFDLCGRSPVKTNLGFRGLEFAVLDSASLVFSTSGQYTDDDGSQGFALAFVSMKGKLLGFGLPLTKTYRNINFSSANRFYRKDNKLSFIATFSNVVYSIERSGIKRYLNFDFGKSQLTESRLSKIKQVEDYNFFRFVIDLQYCCSSGRHCFFSYSRNGKEGYVLTDRLTGEIAAEGTGSIIDRQTGFNPVPFADVNDQLVAIKIKTVAGDKSITGRSQKNPRSAITLMFYKLNPAKLRLN